MSHPAEALLGSELFAACALALAVCLVGGRSSRWKPVDSIGDVGIRTIRRRPSLVEDDRARTFVCVAACAVVGFVVLEWIGLVIGAAVGPVLSRLLGRLESPAAVRERERLVRDLPIAVDLMAACARAGLPLSLVVPQVAQAVGGPLERRLTMVTSRWDLGADPVREWQVLESDPVLRPLGAAMVRAHRSGAPLAATLVRVAADARRERRTQALAAARSMAVSSAAPLAVCFLPAFLLVGVVPTVIGGFTHLF